MPDGWTRIPLTEQYVRGAFRLEPTARGVVPHRLPKFATVQAADPQLTMAQAQPSGVRVALRTTATAVAIDGFRSRTGYTGVPLRPDGIIDLAIDGAPVAQHPTSGGALTMIDLATREPRTETGEPFTIEFGDLAGVDKTVELWLPHQESVELIDVRANASVDPVVSGRRRWVHHGSSISQGSNAVRPTGTWPALVAGATGVDLMNLGFGGSALLDPFLARTIRDLPADLISVKIGINLVNADLMRMRAFRPAVHGFIDTIRDGHPDTPLLIVSPISTAIHETTPGPGAFDLAALAEGRVRFTATGDPGEVAAGRLTLSTIRDAIATIVDERRASDPQLYHLDGRALYNATDEARQPLPDGLHPDPDTHRLIAERFTAEIFDSGPFAETGAPGDR